MTIDGQTLDPAVLAARERGVVFDVGHGNGAFSWTVAEVAGFWPDVISTDLHAASIHGPAYDMPTCMTKFLMLGMPLVDVIQASTEAAAASVGWADRVGTLGVGRVADIALLQLEPCDAQLECSFGQLRHCTERLVTRAVWRAGEACPTTTEQVWPNPESAAEKHANVRHRPRPLRNLCCLTEGRGLHSGLTCGSGTRRRRRRRHPRCCARSTRGRSTTPSSRRQWHAVSGLLS